MNASIEHLRRAAALMVERANAAHDTPGCRWRLGDLAGANEVWSPRDPASHDASLIASTATRLNPNPGIKGASDALHIASWDPHMARAVAAWLTLSADWREANPDDWDDDPDPEIGDPALDAAFAYLRECA